MSLNERVEKALAEAKKALESNVVKAQYRRFKVKIKGQDAQPDVVIEGDSWNEIGAHVEATSALQAAAQVLKPTVFKGTPPVVVVDGSATTVSVTETGANTTATAVTNQMSAPHSVQKLAAHPWTHPIRVCKADETLEERFVLGIVLEPEVVDAQKDIYSDVEIRKAAHGFMEHYAHVGLMHKDLIDGRVKILESYVTPSACTVDGVVIKAGTWMMGARIVDDALWEAVKKGEFNGWSIGGTAVREPETSFEQLMSVFNS